MTTYFAAGQPSINLSFRRKTSKKLIDLQKYANCFCALRINLLPPEISRRFAGNHQLLF